MIEYTKDNIFLKYNSLENVLEYKEVKSHPILKFLNKNKFIIIMLSSLSLLIIINTVLISIFIKLLNNL